MINIKQDINNYFDEDRIIIVLKILCNPIYNDTNISPLFMIYCLHKLEYINNLIISLIWNIKKNKIKKILLHYICYREYINIVINNNKSRRFNYERSTIFLTISKNHPESQKCTTLSTVILLKYLYSKFKIEFKDPVLDTAEIYYKILKEKYKTIK